MMSAIAPAPASCAAGATGQVIPADIAAAKAIAIARPVAEVERAPLFESFGRVLAADIVATINLPPFDNSAMDGCAVPSAVIAPSQNLGILS